jgi:hypothetical protein
MLGQILRDIVLGYLPSGCLTGDSCPGGPQAFALTHELLVTSQLLIKGLQTVVDLSDNATRSSANNATRSTGHEGPPRSREQGHDIDYTRST